MFTHSGLADALFLASAALFVGGWIAFFVRSALWRQVRHPRHAGAVVVPLRRLARREIIPIATGDRLIVLSTCAAAALLLTAALALGGRFDGRAALEMAALIAVLAGLFGCVVLTGCVRPLTPLLRRRNAFPFGVTFRYIDGAWQYADGEWFVRIEEAAACALHAPNLELSKPIRYSTRFTVDNGGRALKLTAYNTLRFATQTGGIYTAKTGYCPALERWVLDHGGRME